MNNYKLSGNPTALSSDARAYIGAYNASLLGVSMFLVIANCLNPRQTFIPRERGEKHP